LACAPVPTPLASLPPVLKVFFPANLHGSTNIGKRSEPNPGLKKWGRQNLGAFGAKSKTTFKEMLHLLRFADFGNLVSNFWGCHKSAQS